MQRPPSLFLQKARDKGSFFYNQSFFVISPIKFIPFLKFSRDHLRSTLGITCGRGSFAVHFGDHLRLGIIRGTVQHQPLPPSEFNIFHSANEQNNKRLFFCVFQKNNALLICSECKSSWLWPRKCISFLTKKSLIILQENFTATTLFRSFQHR